MYPIDPAGKNAVAFGIANHRSIAWATVYRNEREAFRLRLDRGPFDLVEGYIVAGATKFAVRPVCSPRAMQEQMETPGREAVPMYYKVEGL